MALSFFHYFSPRTGVDAALEHHREGRLDDAQAAYLNILAADPDHFDALHLLGALYKQRGRIDDAIELMTRAVAVDPTFAAVHNNLGTALRKRNRRMEAIASFRQAIALDPGYAKAYYNLGHAVDDPAEALRCFSRAMELAPDLAEARWAWTMAQVTPVSETDRDPLEGRRRLSAELDALTDWFHADAKRLATGFEAVGVHLPFYLAYHEENNRDLLSRYGKLCTQAMAAWHATRGSPRAAECRGGKICIGIVSAHVREHSVWTAIVKGWMQQFDREGFELHLFHVGAMQDSRTDFARSLADSFVQGPGELEQWVDAIRNLQPDVLMYPEIGMDPMATKLAALRLAPVQATTWGHPETSGFPTIDYYFSAEDFEPESAGAGAPDAQDRYSENLVVLPGLGCSYPPLLSDRTTPDLAALGIKPDVPLLLCPGAVQKYQPRDDWTFVEIARRLGECQFVFVLGSHAETLWPILRRRLETTFANAGLDAGRYLVFIPWQIRPAFFGLMQRADVCLDTIGFSGFNTVMQAVECALPIVTREGRFLRGRFGSGILKRMGLSDLVARTDEEYIALAVKIAADPVFRGEFRDLIDEHRHVLFNDAAPVKALEAFLADAVRAARFACGEPASVAADLLIRLPLITLETCAPERRSAFDARGVTQEKGALRVHA